MNARNARRLLVLAFLSLAATACGSSSLLAPDCQDALTCDYIPDSGGDGGDGYIPDSGGEFTG